MPIRAVIDSNVIVSGVLTKEGIPAQIIKAWREEKFELLTSLEILKELVRVLHYPHIAKHFDSSEIDGIIRLLQRYAVIVKKNLFLDVIKKDPSDNKFLSCAIEGNAKFIVSGDSHLKALKNY